MQRHPFTPLLCALTLLLAAGCTPTVQIAAPSEPITINLNVKIKHEILVKVDKEIDTMLDENSELF
ncbi:MAG: YnbE family lipoprotein [Oceanospirillales bacterium]|uniref:YnbE-like lipoprotein n=1 Tax=Marinobacterium halophilum TaxID=267374 RepID=A0A2P8F222_9GAMM|nr:YnbE family lipoprotein [Marinobacterium halophilum]MBR9827640.1 YnbE family lipoprotein [Oceanospirillales bacterium]PSL15760.1 YnbE-like lipoprotein [Marinobacterium halophilum]